MAYFQQKKLGVKVVSQPVKVPDNALARLMYYFNCVCLAIECDMTPRMKVLANYQRWMCMTPQHVKELIEYCVIFNPNLLNDRVFFRSNELCGDRPNRFIELTEMDTRFIVAPSIIIGGQAKTVTKVMVYKLSWMNDYYVAPMRQLIQYYGRL